jgi:BON domain
MKFAASLLLLILTTVAAVSALPQKAEPNPQIPATPQANSSSAMGSSNAPGIPAADDAALQGRIQQALQSEPSLSASHVSVAVTNTEIQLTGTAASGKDKETAERIAASFDGNRHLTDKLLVTGQANQPATAGTPSPKR